MKVGKHGGTETTEEPQNQEQTEQQEQQENQEEAEPEESTNVVTMDKDEMQNSESGTIENESQKSNVFLLIAVGIIAVMIVVIVIIVMKKRCN